MAYVFAILIFLGCRDQIAEETNHTFRFDKIAILPESELKKAIIPCSRNPIHGASTAWIVKESDIVSIEQSLEPYLRGRVDSPLQDYYRQYIGLILDGERVISIHAFKPPPSGFTMEQVAPKWRREYVRVCDGGQDSWGLIYHLNNSRFSNFEINAAWSGSKEPGGELAGR